MYFFPIKSVAYSPILSAAKSPMSCNDGPIYSLALSQAADPKSFNPLQAASNPVCSDNCSLGNPLIKFKISSATRSPSELYFDSDSSIYASLSLSFLVSISIVVFFIILLESISF